MARIAATTTAELMLIRHLLISHRQDLSAGRRSP